MSDNTYLLYAGRFTSSGKLHTNDAELFLSSLDQGSISELKEAKFNEAAEKEGLYVILKAQQKGKVLFDCEIIEQLDVISSRLLKRLLEDMPELRGKTLDLIQDLRDEIIGTDEFDEQDDLAIKTSGPLPLCALVVGHKPSAKGAEGKYRGKTINEFDYNSELATMIASKVTAADVHIVFRDNVVNGYSKLPAKVNRLEPKFIISLHLNAANGIASGSETLYYHTSAGGEKLAEILQKQFIKHLDLKNRKTKPRRSGDRGITLLKYTNAPAVIGEPGFIDSTTDLTALIRNKEALADAYAQAIDEYAQEISISSKSKAASKAVDSQFIAKDLKFKVNNLTKQKFLSSNESLLLELIDGINSKLSKKYKNDFIPVSKTDFWVLFNSECGLTNKGTVNINHTHSEGERGLLPLPANVKFWNGSSAPQWDRISSVGKNIEHFILYLGQLKNKKVKTEGNYTYYSGFFRAKGIKGYTLREARLLSGIVHGYLYYGNFSNKVVPVAKILNGFKTDKPLTDFMSNTKYIHAKTNILANREQNINEAVSMV